MLSRIFYRNGLKPHTIFVIMYLSIPFGGKLMKHIRPIRLTAIMLIPVLLCGLLTGCDEIFHPVETTSPETDETNPYIHWQDPTDPTGNPSTDPTGPSSEGEVGYVSSEHLNIRSGPGVEYDLLGVLYMGNQVLILETRAVDGALWGLTEDGWISMDNVTMGNAPSLTGIVTSKTLNIRTGPGTDNDAVGSYKKGETIIILEQTMVGNNPWGRTTDGWVSMQYVSIQGITAERMIGKVTTKVLNVREGAGINFDVVEVIERNDEVTITEVTTVSGVEWGYIGTGWVSMQYIQILRYESSEPQETPEINVEDTSIVGSWICMDEESYFSGGTIAASTWTFRQDGTYTNARSQYTYMENIGWQGFGDTKETAGSFTFDGRTLTLTNAADETLNILINGDIMEVYGHRTHSLMLRTYDVNVLIKTLIKRDRAQSKENIQGSWGSVHESGYVANVTMEYSSWYFGSDGSFSQTTSTYQYSAESGWTSTSISTVLSGVYFYDGTRLTLCYESETDGTTWETKVVSRYVIAENAAISVGSFRMEGLLLVKGADPSELAQTIN